MSGEFAVAAVEDRLGADVERRSDHGGLEVVGDDGLRHAAEPLERRDVQGKPRIDLLVEDDARELMARVSQHHQKHVRGAQPLLRRVPQLADRAEVDLGDLSRQGHDRNRDVLRTYAACLGDAGDHALDRRQASAKLLVVES